MIASIWSEAHRRYLALRQEYPGAGPEVSNFDNAWNVWSTNRPAPTAPESLDYVSRVLSFYKEAGSALAAKQAQSLPAIINGALPAYWMVGAELARLAAKIDETRPRASRRQDVLLETSIHTTDDLNGHIDLVAAYLAKIIAAIESIRVGNESG